MEKFYCRHCGDQYSINELNDYSGECIQCGANIPSKEELWEQLIDIKLLDSLDYDGSIHHENRDQWLIVSERCKEFENKYC